MRVELICHEHPHRVWISGERLGNMGRKISFGAPRPERGRDYLPANDVQVNDRRERAMPFVLKFVTSRPPRSHGLRRCNSFQRLHPSQFIRADDMAAQRRQ